MAKLFNNIRKKLISEKPSANRTTNYLKYGIGEIVLVVIGILIALWIAEWNNQRHQHQNEIIKLKQIEIGLTNDLIKVNDNIISIDNGLKRVKTLDSLIKTHSSPNIENMNSLFGAVYALR